MIKKLFHLVSIFSLLSTSTLYAESTHRTPQFSNDKVTVWETVISPEKNQALKMHKHDSDRVLIAFDEGTLKITNTKGESHLLKLEKNKAYYLTKKTGGEMHTDTNISNHPIHVMIIELH